MIGTTLPQHLVDANNTDVFKILLDQHYSDENKLKC